MENIMPKKMIAVRVDPDLYYKIKVCSDYANNSMAAWCELLVKQGVSRVYGMIPGHADEVKSAETNDNKGEN
jgi:hypothetical protein